jgi:hypothetical protein
MAWFGLFGSKETPQEEQIPKKTVPDVLNGDDPWGIREDDDTYCIVVYNFETGGYSFIHEVSEKVLGVTSGELRTSMVEQYPGQKGYHDSFWFYSLDDANKAIDQFRPYYDSYYMPRAVMDRLSCYTPGGLIPHYIKHPKIQTIIKENPKYVPKEWIL